MGLPVPFVIWANGNPNFPAGPDDWDGTPVAVSPPGNYFAPNTKPAAQFHNYLHNGETVTIEALRGWSGVSPAINWSISQGPINGETAIQAACATFPTALSTYTGGYTSPSWVVADTSTTGNIKVYLSDGTDGTLSSSWTQLGSTINLGTPALGIAICADNVTPGDFWLAVAYSSTGNEIFLYHYHAGAWAQITGPASNGAIAASLVTPTDLAIKSFKGSGNQQIVMCSGGTQDIWSWDVIAHTVNTVFFPSSGTANRLGIRTSKPAYQTGGDIWVYSSGNAGGNVQVLMHSTDGLTWTNVAPTLSSTTYVTGFCAVTSSLGSGYLLSVWTGTANNFYYSSDGVTLFAAISAPSFANVVADMESLGALVLCSGVEGSSGGNVPYMFSADGGLTWYPAPQNLNTSSALAATAYIRGRIIQNGQGFLTHNNLWMRFSQLAGLPLTGSL